MIGALGEDERLLARGIAVADFRLEWEALGELAGSQPAEAGPNQVGSWMLAAPRPGIVGRAYLNLVAASAHSVPDVVDWLVSLPEVDPSRIAVAGSSTHGFIALEALRLEPRLSAAVVRAACGDYHAFLRSSALALADDPRWLEAGELRLDPDYEAELREREPVRFAGDYPPRPLLLLAGGEDRAIPLACVESTERAFARAYARAGVPGRFQLVVYEHAGHDLAEQSRDRVLDWWERWLRAPPGAG